MRIMHLIMLISLFSCSAQKEIVKIQEKQIKIEGKEYTLSDLDFDYEVDKPVLLIDTVLTESEPSSGQNHKLKVKMQVRKKEKKADIQIITLPTYITSVDTTTTVVLEPDAKSEFKFWGYWLLGFLILLAIVLFIWKSK